MKEKTVRVGIIGCGGIANRKHLPSLTAIPGVEAVGFYDLRPENARASAEQFGTDARVYDSYQQLLADDRIDVVHICTPNGMHAPIAIDALDAGKHVMCEKPMATSAADAEKMCEAAKRNGKNLSVSYQNRFRRDSQYVYNMVQKGELGEIYYAKAHAVRRRGVPAHGYFLNREAQGGGSLIDQGTHALALTLWLMDNYEPESVVGTTYNKLSQFPNAANAWGSWNPAEFEVEEAAMAFIRMKNGATLVLENCWAMNILNVDADKSTLCGTLGGIDMVDGLRVNGEHNGKLYVTNVDLYNASGIRDYPIEAVDNPYQTEAEAWINAIRTGTRPVVRAEQALTVARIIDAIYESAKTGRQVFL